MKLNRANQVTDAAYDALIAIYKRNSHIFSAAYSHGCSLRRLAKAHGINPDM